MLQAVQFDSQDPNNQLRRIIDEVGSVEGVEGTETIIVLGTMREDSFVKI